MAIKSLTSVLLLGLCGTAFVSSDVPVDTDGDGLIVEVVEIVVVVVVLEGEVVVVSFSTVTGLITVIRPSIGRAVSGSFVAVEVVVSERCKSVKSRCTSLHKCG